MTESHTLAEFEVPIALHCFHCGRKLPRATPIEITGSYVIAHCPKCRCMTPFKVEKSA